MQWISDKNERRKTEKQPQVDSIIKEEIKKPNKNDTNKTNKRIIIREKRNGNKLTFYFN
jgi:hypothetical protein